MNNDNVDRCFDKMFDFLYYLYYVNYLEFDKLITRFRKSQL